MLKFGGGRDFFSSNIRRGVGVETVRHTYKNFMMFVVTRGVLDSKGREQSFAVDVFQIQPAKK